jgi:NADPH-dependent curcumin reductase CurA
LWLAVGKRTKMRGFIVSDHYRRLRDFLAEVTPLVESGTISYQETIVPGGLEAAPAALIDLLDGAKIGKMLVAL